MDNKTYYGHWVTCMVEGDHAIIASVHRKQGDAIRRCKKDEKRHPDVEAKPYWGHARPRLGQKLPLSRDGSGVLPAVLGG